MREINGRTTQDVENRFLKTQVKYICRIHGIENEQNRLVYTLQINPAAMLDSSNNIFATYWAVYMYKYCRMHVTVRISWIRQTTIFLSNGICGAKSLKSPIKMQLHTFRFWTRHTMRCFAYIYVCHISHREVSNVHIHR